MYKCLSLIAVVAALLLSGCAQKTPYDYTAFRASRPASIVVLPAKNSSPDVKASHSFISVVTAPLAESGYYVFPVAVVEKTFEQNGLANAADAQAVSTKKLREIFNADAALYLDVTDYGAQYKVIDSVIAVRASARLVDLRTGKQIWSGTGYASDQQDSNNSGLMGMLIGAAIKQIASNITDKSYPIAEKAGIVLLTADGNNGSILPGPRRTLHFSQ